MKIISIVAAVVAGLLAVVALSYFLFTQFPKIMAEYGPETPINAQAELQNAEAKLAAAKDDYARWVALGGVVYWQSTQADTDRARKAAIELLAMAENYKTDWNYGNAIHKANSALSRIALRGGDRDAAKKYLLASASTKGSPQMNSFGPNMGLAKEMLEAGEKDAVLEYFALCHQFWELGHGELEVWTRMVKEGRAPKFGASLFAS